MTIGAANSIAALLSADHRAVDALLAEVKRRLAAGAIGPAARLFAEFRAGLERHIAAEEEILFPALESRLAAHGPGPVRVMRAEHAELTRLMAEVAALESTSLESHATPLPALTARIYAHNGKEERMLYPMADLAINDAPERAGLLRRLAAATTHTRGLRGAGALPPAID